jgi:DDB1- and CUL4-associated factor 13
MRINTIYHKPEEIEKERRRDLGYASFSKRDAYHPFMAEREFVRALNATKIERMLSKPLVAALAYHNQGVNNLSRHPTEPLFVSSSFDNTVILWDMAGREIVRAVQCQSIVRGLALDESGNIYAGQERSVKVLSSSLEYLCEAEVNDVSICGTLNVATANALEIFDMERSRAGQRISASFPRCLESSLLLPHIVVTAENSLVSLIDTRVGTRIASAEAGSQVNALCFSPTDAHIFVSANEDKCALLHDIRFAGAPRNIFRGHANAVLALAFSPNGDEVSTGSYDKTIRIFGINDRKSRDVYHCKRMQYVHGLEYSHDSRFLVSGSDDGSIRLWKTSAAKRLGPLSRREKDALAYSEALKEKYKDVGEISRISRHRFLPRVLKQELRTIHEAHEARLRRAEGRKREQEE